MVGQSALAADGPPDGGGRAHAGVVPGTRSLAVPRPALAGYPVLGIDVSSHDHSQHAIDWPGVASSGMKFAYVKASEGQFYTNPYFHADNQAAKAAGLLTGAYAFGRPDLGDPVGEANYFMDRSEWQNDAQTLVPFLDMEWPYPALHLGTCYGLTPSQIVGWVRAFVEQVRARTGRAMMIYTNTNWWNPCTANDTSFGAYPLDIAGYTSAPPPLPAGWNQFTLWQYAGGNNSVPGNYDADAFNGDYTELTRLAGGRPAAAAPFGLSARANNRYVTAENAGSRPLIANRGSIGNWETFDPVDAGDGYIALRAHANGRYVTAESAGAQPLIANRTAIGAWEKFKIVDNPDGSISLLANANGLYVTAENAGARSLIASRGVIGLWEKFDQLAVPAVMSLFARANGKYVTAEKAGAQPLIANRSIVGPWEAFDAVDAGDGYIALRAHANGRYVTAEGAGAQPLIANRTAIGAWEKFKIVDNPDGSISLLANANGLYVTAENAGARSLIANRNAIGLWEEFYR
jgi:GH25 family lysozyme M1 (1,4-beta-N-acetylmuramidase)